MKGVAGSAGAVAVIALGLVPGVGATGTTSLRQEPSDSHGLTTPVGVDTAAGSPSSTDALNGGGSISRRLQSDARRNQVVNDDALDANGTVSAKNMFFFVCFYYSICHLTMCTVALVPFIIYHPHLACYCSHVGQIMI